MDRRWTDARAAACARLPGVLRQGATSGWSRTCSATATGTPARATTARCCPPASGQVVVGGEAMLPAFVAADPYGAGHRRGARQRQRPGRHGRAPGRARRHRRRHRGGRAARSCAACAGPASCYDVPDRRRAPDAQRRATGAVGVRHRPGRARAVGDARGAPGQVLVARLLHRGRMRPDFLFFPSFERARGPARRRRPAARGAGRVRARASRRRTSAWPAWSGRWRCCSSPNRLGRRASTSTCCPVPDGVALGDWLSCFPCFAFLLTVPADRVDGLPCAGFRGRGLAAAQIGASTTPGRCGCRRGRAAAVVFDLAARGRRRNLRRLSRPQSTAAVVSEIDVIGWCGTPR